jgi:hypothetical protein
MAHTKPTWRARPPGCVAGTMAGGTAADSTAQPPGLGASGLEGAPAPVACYQEAVWLAQWQVLLLLTAHHHRPAQKPFSWRSLVMYEELYICAGGATASSTAVVTAHSGCPAGQQRNSRNAHCPCSCGGRPSQHKTLLSFVVT